MRCDHTARPLARHAGFTLIEMLVSVALTLVIMLMFTSIFEITTGSMQKAKGLAENDQKARLLTNVLRNDIEQRTFRNLYPYYLNETFPIDPDDLEHPLHRRGYFYISENEPDDPTDDVLQFTVQIPEGIEPFYGKAAVLGGGVTADPNQPEFDDQNSQANGAGQSRWAEVSYFLRNGMLYRRVLLIRNRPSPDHEPTSSLGAELVTSLYPNSLWADFDYSAHQAAGSNPEFAGIDYLDNTSGAQSLGVPGYRFGHDFGSGTPKEFMRVNEADETSLVFIGRYTHEETSHLNFRYPSALNGFPDPMAPDPGAGQSTTTRFGTLANTPAGVVQYLNPGNQAWEPYRGPRRSEDVMLSNVHAFDIEVWDEGLGPDLNSDTFPDGAFAQLGHTETDDGTPTGNPIGAYNINNRANAAYGPVEFVPLPPPQNPPVPLPPQNRVFDTWHPSLGDPPFHTTNTNGDDVPLKMIRITLRYMDVTSDQFREQTLTFSVIDDEQT